MKLRLNTIGVVLATLVATAASAQQAAPRSERPYRGLFAGGVGETEQLLTLTASLGAGYDDNVLADAATGPGAGQGGEGPTQSGGYGYFSGGASYSVTRTRIALSGSGTLSGRYLLTTADSPYLATRGLSGGASFGLTKRTRITVNGGASFQPFTTLQLGPSASDLPLGEIYVPDQALAARRGDQRSLSGTVALRRELGRRSSFSADYAYSRSDVAQQRGLESEGGSARLVIGVAKGLGVRLGYGYRDVALPITEGPSGPVSGEAVREHNIDAGLDFARALSFTRRTTLSFATGSSAVRLASGTQFRVTGDARLNRELGRTWNASLAYSRGLGFTDTFSQPLFSDTVTASVAGLLTRRLQWSSSFNATFGQVGLTGAGNGYRSSSVTTALNTGLTRNIGIGADYTYYRHGFDQSATVPVGVSRQLDRNAVRTYLTLWTPLVHRARKTDATR